MADYELKRCPFCGGDVHFDRSYSYFRDVVVYCDECDTIFALDDCTAVDSDLVRAWNRRADNGCMDNVSCVLLDKCGFHVREETSDEHDARSLEYLQQCLVELVKAKNNGYIKMADIEKALRGEYTLVNSAE